MLVHNESPMHVILECQEMEYRETPAVLTPGMEAAPAAPTSPDGDVATMGPTITPAQPATIIPMGDSTNTPQGTTAAPPSIPSAVNPAGSFALPSQNTSQTAITTLPDPNAGYSVYGGSASLMVASFSSNAAGAATVSVIDPFAAQKADTGLSTTTTSSASGSAAPTAAPATSTSTGGTTAGTSS